MAIETGIFDKDNYLKAQKDLKTFNSTFKKNFDGTMQRLNVLNDQKILLKVDLEKAEKVRTKAEKSFAKTSSEDNKLKLQQANTEYEKVQRNFDLISKNANQAQSAVEGWGDKYSKSLKTVIKGEAGQMLGKSVSGAVEAGVSSAFGSEAGSAVGKTMNGAISGAIAGSAGGIVGAVIGGVIGLISGGIDAAIDIFEKKDEAFKKVVNDSFNKIKQKEQVFMTNSAAIAMQKMQADVAGEEPIISKYYEAYQKAEKSKNDLMSIAGETFYEVQTKSMENEAVYFDPGSETGKLEAKMAKADGVIAGELESQERQLVLDAKTALATGNVSENIKDPKNIEKLKALSDELKRLDIDNNVKDMQKAKQIYRQAENIAQNEFVASDSYQDQQTNDRELYGLIRGNTALSDSYYLNDYLLAIEASKGILSVGADEMQKKLDTLEKQYYPNADIARGADEDASVAANNLNFIHKIMGFNKYASSAPNDSINEQFAGPNLPIPISEIVVPQNTSNITINLGGATIREEADIEKLVQSLSVGLIKATQLSAM